MKVKEKIEQFEAKRNSLLDRLAEIDSDRLAARPLDGKWSVIEIVEHMVVAEKEVLMGLPDPAKLKVYRRTLKNKMMLKVVMFVLGRINVKVPSPTMNPEGEADLEELRRRWDENQKWFRNYVDSCSDEDLEKAVFKHPVSGPINVEQAVDMSIAHIDAHTAQIDKLLEIVP